MYADNDTGIEFLVTIMKLFPLVANFFLKKWANPASFSFIFGLFKQTSIQFLQQIYVKNVHPVYGAGIRTHDLRNVSLFP